MIHMRPRLRHLNHRWDAPWIRGFGVVPVHYAIDLGRNGSGRASSKHMRNGVTSYNSTIALPVLLGSLKAFSSLVQSATHELTASGADFRL